MNQLECKRCLLYEMADAAQYQNLYDYLKEMDEDLKVSHDIYEKRLAICKECDNLLSGMCRICGCYVELRGILKNQHCPSTKHLW